MENGNETESVDVMHYIWNKEWPANRTPYLEEFVLDGKGSNDNVRLESGKRYQTTISVKDHEEDGIKYSWDMMPESTDLGDGGDFESTPKSLSVLVKGKDAKAKVTAPDAPGAYRLFIYAHDGQGHTAHANIPFYVN